MAHTKPDDLEMFHMRLNEPMEGEERKDTASPEDVRAEMDAFDAMMSMKATQGF